MVVKTTKAHKINLKSLQHPPVKTSTGSTLLPFFTGAGEPDPPVVETPGAGESDPTVVKTQKGDGTFKGL